MFTIHSTLHSVYSTEYCTLYMLYALNDRGNILDYSVIEHIAHCTVHGRLYSLHCTAQFWGRNRFCRSTAAAAISRSPAVGLTRRPVRSSWLEVWLQNDGDWERKTGLNEVVGSPSGGDHGDLARTPVNGTCYIKWYATWCGGRGNMWSLVTRETSSNVRLVDSL